MTISEKIQLQIRKELGKITESSYPHVWALASSKSGYQMVEEQIIDMMIAQNITISTAISLIESDNV
jgi:uncharacterized protein YaaN involved in tellurite resistance